MRALIERVSRASVEVDGEVVGEIGEGMLAYIGVQDGDGEEDVKYIANKIRHLRFFEDDAGKMNLDVSQKGGSVLAISAFTLQADARKGRRPSFDGGGDPAIAETFYLKLVDALRDLGLKVETGKFAAMMEVSSVNHGPITMLLDSRKLF